MAKGGKATAGLLSKRNVTLIAAGAVVTLYVLGKIQEESDPKSMTYKFGQFVNLKPKSA